MGSAAPARAAPSDDARVEPPQVDAATVVLFADQGRVEVTGRHLEGARLRWQARADGGPNAGEDVCWSPKVTSRGQQCVFGVGHGLDINSSFDLLPSTGTARPAGSAANPVAPVATLRPARVVLDRLLPAAAAIDLTNGAGRLVVLHPEAVASADCGQARCELSAAAVQVGAVPGSATALTLRLRLAPRYYVLGRDDAQEAVVSRTIAVVHCQASVISGPPPRHGDATRMIVRLDARCGAGARDLLWTMNGDRVRVERTVKESSRDDAAVDVQLAVGDIEDAHVTLTASRPEPDGSVIAIAHEETLPALQPHAAIELPGFGKIDFVPTNREAVLRTAPPGPGARLVPVPVEGAYRVRLAEGKTDVYVQAEEGAGGFVALRFGYRVEDLPPAFAATDLALVTEPLQRPIREASVPAPLASSLAGAEPLLELMCIDAGGRLQRITPGAETSIPFGQRDSCRLIIHRERLRTEDGTQDIAVDVAITKVDDSPRTDAHQLERMVIRAGKQPRMFWIHGIKAPFDRLSLRVSHVIDEDHDVGGSDLHVNLPAAQWAVVAGQAHLRFYATAAIPTGLYRITVPSDVLTLNFGALSRLTWLDHEGHEGLIGLEAGALGIGLAATPNFPRTLAILGGLGVAVPIGNRGDTSQASVNLHAWIAYELRGPYRYTPDPSNMNDVRVASHWSFLFGPSITIGNVGTDL